MVTLLTAYTVAAAAIAAYAAWLMIGTSRLARRLHRLPSVTDGKPDNLPAKRIA